MRVVAIVQARLGSERLPQKVLADIGGKPMLAHVVARAKRIVGVDEVVIAGPSFAEAVTLAKVADTWGYGYDEVGENDVLTRFVRVAETTGADLIVRLTGDCPLLDPEAGRAVMALARAGCPYVTNDTTVTGWPDGCDVQAFSRTMLLEADRQVTDPYDREHVCTWMDRQPEALMVGPTVPFVYDQPKLSVDTEDDLDRVRAIYRHLAPDDYSLAATLRAYRAAGELAE